MIKLNNVKKAGVISDTHIPTRKKNMSEKIFYNFKDTDFIIHCGDIVNENVIKFLSKISKTYAVKGNMDPSDINYPDELILKINNKFILCVTHGNGAPFDLKQRMYKKFITQKPDIIIFGHTHCATYEEYLGVKFFNPGSATCGISSNTIGIINFSPDKIICEIVII